MADHLRTELVIDALAMASRNHPLTEGAIFHSDRGTQYTSAAYAAAIDRLNIQRSVGTTGVFFDNALAESFNAAVKVDESTAPSTPPANTPERTSPGTSNSATILNVSTRLPDPARGLRRVPEPAVRSMI
ncbi:MAG: hypothetical protein ACRDRI_01930 [Pseudonocardiaceae bacterium]